MVKSVLSLKSISSVYSWCWNRVMLFLCISCDKGIHVLFISQCPNFLLVRYCEGKFISKYISTIGVDYGVKPVDFGEFQVRFENFKDVFFQVYQSQLQLIFKPTKMSGSQPHCLLFRSYGS